MTDIADRTLTLTRIIDASPEACFRCWSEPELIRQAIEEGSDEEGWAHLGSVGNYLNKIRPDFDPRLYGQKKLSDLLRQHPRHFKVEERTAPGSSGKTLFVRAMD